MEDQSNTHIKTAASTIVITLTPEGVELPVIHADTEEAQAQMKGLLGQIKPYLDVVDAIIKKTSAGPRG